MNDQYSPEGAAQARKKMFRRVVLGASPLLLIAGVVGGGALVDQGSTIAENHFGIQVKEHWKDNDDDNTSGKITLQGPAFNVRFDASSTSATETWTAQNTSTHQGSGELKPTASAKTEYGPEAANIHLSYKIDGKDQDGGTLANPTSVHVGLDKAAAKDKPSSKPIQVTAQYTGKGADAKTVEVDTADFKLDYVLANN